MAAKRLGNFRISHLKLFTSLQNKVEIKGVDILPSMNLYLLRSMRKIFNDEIIKRSNKASQSLGGFMTDQAQVSEETKPKAKAKKAPAKKKAVKKVAKKKVAKKVAKKKATKKK